MANVLDEIVTVKRQEVLKNKTNKPLQEIEIEAKNSDPVRDFAAALKTAATGPERAGLIAEIKKASPSKGVIREDFDPPALARAYADGGATCLSVLTDGPYFQGAPDDLIAAREAVDLPVLRKDFMIEPYQIVESRAMGADCILLIMAALDDGQAADLAATARDWSLDVLIEVHDGAELDRALRLDGPLIGINNRDLTTLDVSLSTTERLGPRVPNDRLLVAESGLNTGQDLARMVAAGARAFLIGESLMRQANVGAATRRLMKDARQAA